VVLIIRLEQARGKPGLAVLPMMQRQIKHAAGAFAVCATCKKEPHHFVARGSTKAESPAFCVRPERHQLECACERRTGWCHTLSDAVHAWSTLGETVPVVTDPNSNVLSIRPRRTR
jgi:hypothetical protein